MNILVVAPFVPWPLNNGGRIRIFSIVQALARRHHVTLVCLAESATQPLGPLPEVCRRVVPVVHRPHAAVNVLKFLFGPNPYNVERFRSPSLLAAIRDLRRDSIDVVDIEHAQMWSCSTACEGLPIVLGTHNVESDIVRQLANACRNPLKRMLYRIETAKMRRFEEHAWRSCDRCLTVSEKEREVVVAAGVTPSRVLTVPNGVDLARLTFGPRPGRKRFLFLGGLDYRPNEDALQWLLAEIWPRVRAGAPQAELVLAGRGTERFGASGLPPGVTCIGDPGDPGEVASCLSAADGLLVPLRIGAGTRIKILEAMAVGVPVVTTTRGGEGIAAVNGTHLLIGDTPGTFADACVRLLADPALSATLAANARRLVEDHYSFEKIGARVLDAIDTIVPGTKRL